MFAPKTKKAARMGDFSKKLWNVFCYFLFFTFLNAQPDTGFAIPKIRIRTKRLIRIRMKDNTVLIIVVLWNFLKN